MSINSEVEAQPEVVLKGKYKVVFKGHLLPGYDMERVVANIVQLTKIPAEKITRKFFNGKVVIIRRAHDITHAQKLQQLFTDAGLEVFILRDTRQDDEQQQDVASGDAFSDKKIQMQNFLMDNKQRVQKFMRHNKQRVQKFIRNKKK